MSDTVLLERDGPVAHIVLNRPRALNALNEDMAHRLQSATARFGADDSVRCIVIEGADGQFMAGGDVRTFYQWLDSDQDTRRRHVESLLNVVHDTIRNIYYAPKPVVAVVSGAAAGFGLSLVAACDVAIASEDASFSVAYCQIGTSPDGAGTINLPSIIGLKRALSLALTGDRMVASQALAAGLVSQLVAPEAVSQQGQLLAQRLANGATRALARTKALVRRATEQAFEQQLLAEEAAFLASVSDPEFVEGVRAFVEKRPPRFHEK